MVELNEPSVLPEAIEVPLEMGSNRMRSNEAPWPGGPEPGELTLGGAEVQVWAVPLESDAEVLAALEPILAPPERERASHFYFTKHRNRFITGRGALRILLGQYLRQDPSRLEFSYGPFGKPVLTASPARLEFNLAHCEDLALVAFSRLGTLGVDVERVRALEDADELVRRFFSPRESEAFNRLALPLRPEAFFNLWTRKEAWLKATGEGIARYLAEVEVSFLPGEPAALRHVPEHLQPAGNWELRDLVPPTGFAAALAVPVGTTEVRCWRMSRRWLLPRGAFE